MLGADSYFAISAYTYDNGQRAQKNVYFKLNAALRTRKTAPKAFELWKGFLYYLLFVVMAEFCFASLLHTVVLLFRQAAKCLLVVKGDFAFITFITNIRARSLCDRHALKQLKPVKAKVYRGVIARVEDGRCEYTLGRPIQWGGCSSTSLSLEATKAFVNKSEGAVL